MQALKDPVFVRVETGIYALRALREPVTDFAAPPVKKKAKQRGKEKALTEAKPLKEYIIALGGATDEEGEVTGKTSVGIGPYIQIQCNEPSLNLHGFADNLPSIAV